MNRNRTRFPVMLNRCQIEGWSVFGIALLSFATASLISARFMQPTVVRADNNRIFELMIYHAKPGQVAKLESIFRDVSKLQAKHNLNAVGLMKSSCVRANTRRLFSRIKGLRQIASAACIRWPSQSRVRSIGPTRSRAALFSRYASARYPSVLVLTAVLLSSVSGQDRPAGSAPTHLIEIKSLLEKQLQHEQLVGIAAIVVRSSRIVGIGTDGVKHQGESTPLGSADMWHLGSNTKAITAALIARLVEAGKLSWTATPLEIFPELNKTIYPAFRHITIEQLLSHHAGIPSARQMLERAKERFGLQPGSVSADKSYRWQGRRAQYLRLPIETAAF